MVWLSVGVRVGAGAEGWNRLRVRLGVDLEAP